MNQTNAAEQAIETNLIDTKDTNDNRFKRRAYHIVPEINQG